MLANVDAPARRIRKRICAKKMQRKECEPATSSCHSHNATARPPLHADGNRLQLICHRRSKGRFSLNFILKTNANFKLDFLENSPELVPENLPTYYLDHPQDSPQGGCV